MSLSQLEKSLVNIEGHLLIQDSDTGEVLVKRRNAIHFENMSVAIANLLANSAGANGTHNVLSMSYGNGGTLIDGTGAVTYKAPNTGSSTSGLYNETFTKDIDSALVNHTNGTVYSDVVMTSTLDYNIPAGQDAEDTTTDMNGDYVFDEIAVYSANNDMLTHVIFHPVQKSANRKISVVYTLRIRTTYSDV
jgi:hypothetical protein